MKIKILLSERVRDTMLTAYIVKGRKFNDIRDTLPFHPLLEGGKGEVLAYTPLLLLSLLWY